LVSKFHGNIKTNLDALPYALRNEELLLFVLAQLIANLLSSIDGDNTSSLIDIFLKIYTCLQVKLKVITIPFIINYERIKNNYSIAKKMKSKCEGSKKYIKYTELFSSEKVSF
jgi:hypothetical protein